MFLRKNKVQSSILSALVSIFPRSAAIKAERLQRNGRRRRCGATI